MGEDGGDVEAARAFDIHEIAVRALDQALQLVLPGLGFRAGVKEIFALLKPFIMNKQNRFQQKEGTKREDIAIVKTQAFFSRSLEV